MNFWLLLQGVEFFDEKLNSLCMTWLVDHGKPFFIIIVVVIINFSVDDLWSYEWYLSKQLPHADEFFRFFFFITAKLIHADIVSIHSLLIINRTPHN